MAVRTTKTIRLPLKRLPAGAAACPNEDRCQLEVVEPDKTQAIEIVTAEDGSKTVRVGLIEEGGGCDYKVRVGLVADSEGDLLLVRMGNYQSGFYVTVFDVAANRTLDPQAVTPLDANSPAAPASLPVLASLPTFWNWWNYNFQTAVAADINVSGGFTSISRGTEQQPQVTNLIRYDLSDQSDGSIDPRTYDLEREIINGTVDEVFCYQTGGFTFSGLYGANGITYAYFSSFTEHYYNRTTNPPYMPDWAYTGYYVSDTQRPGDEQHLLLDVVFEHTTSTSGGSSALGTTFDYSQRTAWTYNLEFGHGGSKQRLISLDEVCFASRATPTSPTVCSGKCIGGGGSSGVFATDDGVSVWPQKTAVGAFGYYSVAGFYKYTAMADQPAEMAVTGGTTSAGGMGIWIYPQTTGKYFLHTPQYNLVTLYDTVDPALINNNVLSIHDAMDNSNTAKAAGLAASVTELAYYIAEQSPTYFNYGVKLGVSELRACSKKTASA